MNQLNLLSCPLPGMHCISANAGTGKTYAISHLYIRLLLEKKLPIESILVVTFTEAATEELRSRIRSLLKSAYTLADTADAACSSEYQITAIVQQSIQSNGIEDTKETLLRALYSFEESSICTIHSFCQQALRMQAFESGVRFDTQLITDQLPFILETIYDFWRTYLYPASALFTTFVQNRNWTPQNLLSLIRNHLAHYDIRHIPLLTLVPAQALENDFYERFSAAAATWFRCRDEIQSILTQDKALNRNKYRLSSLPRLFQKCDGFFRYGKHNPDCFETFKKLTATELQQSIKKNTTPPQHRFFDLCDDLHAASQVLCKTFETNLCALKTELLTYVRHHLTQKKQQSNVYSFDDLLTTVYTILQSDNASLFIQSIQKRYHAALIDEFQDTDPIQYTIFKTLFDNGSIPLFLIGDPKQAIYSFRGADIFSFLSAQHAVPQTRHHTLQTNWRSDPKLVHAINTLFTFNKNPFLFHQIPYLVSQSPPDEKDAVILSKGNHTIAPMTLWYFPGTRFSERFTDNLPAPISRVRATELLCTAVSAEIASLLNSGTMTTHGRQPINRAITPPDIAILVRTRQEARQMKQALAVLGIPAILHNAGNIFDTIEAQEIQHLLSAIVYPHHHGYIKTALCTSLIGVTAQELYRAAADGTLLDRYYETFQHYHTLWYHYGFSYMFSYFMNTRQVRSKLLCQQDGERRVTNIDHIHDILQQQSIEKHYTMQQLLWWFAAQCNPQSPRLEEHELRLESDENAVQIVTIHKSKGLEYPVVFCPFAWSGSRITEKEFLFHDADHTRVYDLGSDEWERNKALAEKEQLAENIRLLYVALTRAQYACYLAWGYFNNAQTSAPAYLFHAPDMPAEQFSVSALAGHVQLLDDASRLQSLHTIARQSNHTIDIVEYREHPDSTPYTPRTCTPQTLLYRKLSRPIPAAQKFTSFSALTRHVQVNAELPDRAYDNDDEIVQKPQKEDVPTDTASEERNLFTFPRGAHAGNFFHALLETFDFSEKNHDRIDELIRKKLQDYGFDPAWQQTVYELLCNLVRTPLFCRESPLFLSSCPSMHTSKELEFYYPIRTVSPDRLSSLCQLDTSMLQHEHIPQHIETLSFQPVEGYMHGFIDLLFMCNGIYYIIDWKSNFLGDTLLYYDKTTMQQTITEHFYYLQYLLYTLAVDRFLASRIRNYSYRSHFGGVFYIFLRGISDKADGTTGVFFDRCSDEHIALLRKELLLSEKQR